MLQELYREKNMHGSPLFPFVCYIQDSTEPRIIKNYHWHEEVEWIYMIKGEITVEIDMSVYVGTPNTLICIPSQSLHKIKTQGECLYYAFVYKFPLVQSALYDYCESTYMIPLEKGTYRLQKKIELGEESQIEIQRELNCLVETYLNKKNAWQLMIKASLLKIVALLVEDNCLESLLENNSTTQLEKVETMKNLLSYMKSHFTEKIYLKELAKLVNMNETYFSRYFKKTIGKSPIEYIITLRIEYAAKLIRETDYSITEICFMAGFENVSYFIRKFKERKNMTPKQYTTQGGL